MTTASNIHDEISDRTRAIAPGGIGVIHLLAPQIGLINDIDRDLHLHKQHLSYHESDHVLNIAYNLLAGGSSHSYDHAHGDLNRAIELCRRGGFLKITLRGDTDFTQTRHLDRWNEASVRFIFGIDARSNLKEMAENLLVDAYSVLERPTTHCGDREDHKSPIVMAHQFEKIRLEGEEVAKFDYRPTACQTTCCVVVLRKRLSVEKGQLVLFEEYRYFFYMTNDRTSSSSDVVFCANDRCDQENRIGQLEGGIKALTMPVGDLVSNWAYMVMASLAWSLKAWSALLLQEQGRSAETHGAEKRSLLRMEFSTFCVAMIQVPCQIVRTARRIVYRLLSWNPWQGVFLRLLERLHGRRLC